MTARNKNDLRSLIEVGLKYAVYAQMESPSAAREDAREIEGNLRKALSLLPEWQEFDAARKEAWPKEEGWYCVLLKSGGGAEARRLLVVAE